jgi:hypothetical protein
MIYNTSPANNQMSEFLEQQLEQELDKFRPPSRASEPIIKLSIINFHNNSVAVPDCLIPDNLDHSFGIANIRIRDEIPIISEIHFAITIDRSGSMSAFCADGRTKMAHIIHTIENMLRIFHKKIGTKISIRIQSFDDNIYVDIDTVEDLAQQTQEELEAIIAKIQRLSPGCATNIEKALIASNAHLDEYMTNHPSRRVAHILLTDGEISDGSKNVEYLKTLVGNKYPNILMGYGLEHDALLLKRLASNGIHNEYRFVDLLEKAGLVYGEVIHRLLYPAVEDVSLLAENCEIYNYATNMWTERLEIGNLISDEQKIFHIRTTTRNQAQIAIYGRTIHKTRCQEELSDKIIFQTHALPVKVDLGSNCDLTNYLFRQQTQEYLFKTNSLLERQYDLDTEVTDPFAKYNALYQQKGRLKKEGEFHKIIDEKDLLKKQMKEFFKTMLDHVTNHGLKEDEFYKILCDDIYIALKSFDTHYGMMYAAARQTSQGRQQTYSSIPSQDPQEESNDVDLFTARPTRLTRAPSMKPSYSIQDTRAAAIALSKDDLDLDLDMKYTLSQKQTSAYSSIGVLKMMREVSYRAPDPKETELSIDLPGDLIDLPFP